VTFSPPTITWRGQLARLQAQVHQQKPQHGERQGTMRCLCGATLHFTVQSTGLSRGHCSAACGARWCH
jgi:hypothetical protein